MDGFDIYDNGTPKYRYVPDIYDALRVVESGEEIGIISEMFPDVSWENQEYCYTDNGGKLVDRWDRITGYGDQMWRMEIAVFQMENEDINDWIYQILCNDDLAKRIGFKKLFVDLVLRGVSKKYQDAVEAYTDELQEFNRLDFFTNSDALVTALAEIGIWVDRNSYNDLCSAVYGKLKRMRVDDEKQLIAESRALLTSYDDFMFGLKSNQFLYHEQETRYRQQVAQLQAKYDKAVQYLLTAAQSQGVALELPEVKQLEG